MTGPRNISAALYALASMAIISLADNFVAEISRTHGLWQFHVLRACVAVPILVIAACIIKQSLRPRRPGRLALRSLAIATGLVIYFSTLGTMPVAQAGAGLFSSPIWVLVLSALLFGHRITLWQVLAILLGFAGVMVLLRPDLGNLTALSLLPLGAGVFYGLGALLTRYWCADETPLALATGVFLALGLISGVPLVAMSLWSTGATPGFLTLGWEPLTARFTWFFLLQTLGAIITMPLITQAYRIGIPAYVAVFEYSFLVFAGMWAFLLWGEVTSMLVWCGMAMIVASGMAMTALQRRDV